MPGADLRFDGRDLAVTALDSRGLLLAFLGDLFERSAVALEGGFLAGQPLPALHNNVAVLCVEFDAVADPFCQFVGSERGPAAQERLVKQIATPEGLP